LGKATTEPIKSVPFPWSWVLEFCEAARHAHHIEPALNPSAMHIPHPAIVQTKKITGYSLWIDMLSGSSFFDAGQQVTPTLISFNKDSDMCL